METELGVRIFRLFGYPTPHKNARVFAAFVDSSLDSTKRREWASIDMDANMHLVNTRLYGCNETSKYFDKRNMFGSFRNSRREGMLLGDLGFLGMVVL